jgi:hypothetical protein
MQGCTCTIWKKGPGRGTGDIGLDHLRKKTKREEDKKKEEEKAKRRKISGNLR